MDTINKNELWVAEWSRSQDAYHIHTIADMEAVNISTFRDEAKSDWIPIGVFTNHRDAGFFLDGCRKHRELKRARES